MKQLFLVYHDICHVSDETLTGQTSMCGVLKVLAGMLKHGKRDDLVKFGKLFISLISAVVNKILIVNKNVNMLINTSCSQCKACIVALLHNILN